MNFTIRQVGLSYQVYDEQKNSVASFYGPMAKTMAETFVRAMTQVS